MLEQTKDFLQSAYGISLKAIEFVLQCQQDLAGAYELIDEIELHNQAKVLRAFQQKQIAPRHLMPSTGYGYDDVGRDALESVFVDAFGCEDALVRPHIVSGTHAIALSLFGLLLPGDEMLSITGKPYDTLEESIGIRGGKVHGSLTDLGVGYEQVELTKTGEIDISAVLAAMTPCTKVVYLQRSRGYAWRESLSVAQIEDAVTAVKCAHPDVLVVVDNCYGEFTDTREPSEGGADVIAGSLIKNPGGGLAPTGAYIAGRRACIEKIAGRLTTPGIGREVGSYAAGYTSFFQGFFLAPHVTAQAVKGAVLCAKIFEELGMQTLPASTAKRNDIIQAIRFDDEERLIRFCRSIQKAAPVDSHVVPEPWDMPGYAHPVIMAAGAFVQGASIELSADAPIVAPYIAYMQGGLTFDHVALALMLAVDEMKILR